ncbi:MAG: hypothetical protein HFH26_12175, partial [Clostridiaceae bacterium]|nr:hypothetical protein [Clostridiaceae bacterium]
MKKKQLVCSALAAAMMLSTAAPGASAARFSDSNGHWGESSIDRWSNSGVIVGTDSAFNPNGAITRGEMATILSEMLGLEQRANNTYPDLNGGWYTDAMLKCAAAGIMTGDDHGQMRPYDNVTGAEIAVILTKSLDLASSRANYPTTRTGYVKPWAQSYVDAIASRGIAVGNDGTTFEPMQDTSRAAFVTMLDRAVDTYISSPGTYTATGLTIVNTDGTVTLKGSPTSIDITQSSTGGTVKLDHTNVSGTIKLQGSRVRLTASHATIDGDIQVSGNGSTISLDGSTNAGVVQLSSSANSSTITVGSDARAGSIMSDASSTTVNVSGSVNNIQFDRNAASSSVSVRNGARVENLTSNANDVTASGSGTLRRADIYGTNNRVTTPNTVVSRASNTTSSTARNRTYANPRRRSSSDRYDVDFYYNDGSHSIFASERVYSGDRVSNPGEPTRSGYVFDKWRYERYYYGYDRYDYDYDYRYDWDYDWDDWYKSSDWKWDSGEEAYYNRTADLYYDDDGDYYFTIVRGYRSRLSKSEVRSRYGKYYNWGYWYDSSDWKWSSKWDAYYNSDADLYYDDDDDQYFIVVSGRRRNLSSSEVHDRYGKYYYGDSWYDRDDWSWSSSWDAYYNSVAKIYYDDDKDYFFTTSGGSRVRLTDSEARSRLNRYYNGYYDDRYYDRYYYNYRKGETFSFSDRIYGDVDLYAQWTECTDTSSAADLGSDTFWKNAKSIVALRDSITVQSLAVPSGKKLYLPAGITLNVVDGSYTGTVYGPGRINSNSTSTPTPTPGDDFTSELPSTSENKTFTAKVNGTTYTVTFKQNYTVNDTEATSDLQKLAKDILAAVPEGYSLTVNNVPCSTADDILTAIGAAYAVPESRAVATLATSLQKNVTMVMEAAGKPTLTYSLVFVVPSTPSDSVVEEDAVAAFGAALPAESVTVEGFKTALSAALTAVKGSDVKIQVNGVTISSVSDVNLEAGSTAIVKIGNTTKSVTIAADENNGDGNGNTDGSGSGDGNTDGSGSGDGNTDGSGSGDGNTDGSGSGDGNTDGSGSGDGNTDGSGSGDGNTDGSGSGDGNTDGSG